jgi:hypothetical protein
MLATATVRPIHFKPHLMWQHRLSRVRVREVNPGERVLLTGGEMLRRTPKKRCLIFNALSL